MLQAMCKDRIKIDEAELKKVYENLYGEKVQCKIILWPEEQKRDVMRMYDKLRDDANAFDAAARASYMATSAKSADRSIPLAATPGRAPPKSRPSPSSSRMDNSARSSTRAAAS